VAIALSLMADLSVGHIERAFAHQQADHLLVIAKAIGLSWQKRF
jgi:tRNA-binding EMAP/Myf-like protein